MCGIAGFVDVKNFGTADVAEAMARRMESSMLHRGPDAGDRWLDHDAGVALVHRRLSIVDLSSAGAQPMHSADGRYVLVYNGEVYNADDLRTNLEATGIRFRGHSDTEVVLEGCARWGVGETVERLIGMFAFALWDRQERRLWLVRDRLGIKPLYWSLDEGRMLFGSELKALRAHPDCPREIDRCSVAAYLRHNYIPAPRSIYLSVHKLEPGRILSWTPGEEPDIERYWSLDDVISFGRSNPFKGSEGEAADELEELLKDAIGRRMVADVPLGAFLSGGIDSSTVVALMQAQSSRKVRSFSIGFEEEGFNEAEHAAAVARHLGTDHTELYVRPNEARDFIPKIPEYFDEPFSDSSQIPTYLVSQMTRKHVTVALSGDGGDELFGGYSRYFAAQKYGRMLYTPPKPLRMAMAGTIRALSPAAWNRMFSAVPASKRPDAAGHRMHVLADLLASDRDALFRRLVSLWDDPDNLVIGGKEPKGLLWHPSVRDRLPDHLDQMMYLDTLTYLPDDILTKVDRASMAVSLEARVPMIDHRVVAFAWSLPQSMKAKDGRGKRVLRDVLARHVPNKLIDRPKMGFGVPIDNWLRGPLRDWAESHLSTESLKRAGLVRPELVRERWTEHLSGQRNWKYHIWDILMLQTWCERWNESHDLSQLNLAS